MFTVGLTGGIGSGKTTVAECFAAHGIPVVDTDLVARELTAPGGEALGEIRAAFGETVMRPDGELDRAALRRRVFADAVARHQLESILHPRIRQAVEQAVAGLVAPYALVVIPLLVETGGYRDMLSRVLVVDCPEEVQIARVMARSGLTYEEAMAILKAQVGRAERLAAADDVIANTASIGALRREVAMLHQRYLAFAGASLP